MLLLDVEEHDSVAISHRIATQLVTEDHIQQQDFGAVMRTLLLRRQHVGDHQGGKGLRNHFHTRNLSKLTMQVCRLPAQLRALYVPVRCSEYDMQTHLYFCNDMNLIPIIYKFNLYLPLIENSRLIIY